MDTLNNDECDYDEYMPEMTTFWSLNLEPGKAYNKVPENNLQVSMAVLDTTKANNNEGIVQVRLQYKGQEMPVANLSMKFGILQVPLNLSFNPGDDMTFSLKGAKIPVTLTGLTGILEDDSDCGEEEDEESEEEVIPELEVDTPSSTQKRKIKVADKYAAKAMKLENGNRHNRDKLNGESFMSEDSNDDTYNPLGDPDLSEDEHVLEEESILEDENSSSSDEDDDGVEVEMESESDDDEEESEEEAPKTPEVKKSKKTIEMKPMNEKSKAEIQKVKKPLKDSKSPKAQNSPKAPPAPAPLKQDTPKMTKAEKKKARRESMATPSLETKKNQSMNTSVASPAANKENLQGKAQKKKNNEGKDIKDKKQKTQMRKGGVLVEDIQSGTGAEAKSGNMVQMYYVGRFKNNQKTFDKLTSGTPLKFRLGRGEVIKGWDVGVVGMKVGGKRKITVPASMGYGKAGAPPDIPPNSDLEFEVTMMNSR